MGILDVIRRSIHLIIDPRTPQEAGDRKSERLGGPDGNWNYGPPPVPDEVLHKRMFGSRHCVVGDEAWRSAFGDKRWSERSEL
jgi:hypothetical protein